MGKNKNNPVIILLHGGPAEADGMLDYIFEADKFGNIWKSGTKFDVPVYFINGEMDYICSINLVKKYYENITTPKKLLRN